MFRSPITNSFYNDRRGPPCNMSPTAFDSWDPQIRWNSIGTIRVLRVLYMAVKKRGIWGYDPVYIRDISPCYNWLRPTLYLIHWHVHEILASFFGHKKMFGHSAASHKWRLHQCFQVTGLGLGWRCSVTRRAHTILNKYTGLCTYMPHLWCEHSEGEGRKTLLAILSRWGIGISQ